jgi:hypothetical protein
MKKTLDMRDRVAMLIEQDLLPSIDGYGSGRPVATTSAIVVTGSRGKPCYRAVQTRV